MEQNRPQRKPLRIPDYDYSQCNVYFLTICTANREPIFWDKPFRLEIGLPLSAAGNVVKDCIEQIPLRYETVKIEKYCVMPDHIHLLLFFDTAASRRPMVAPTVSRVVQQFKGAVSKILGHSVWQKSYYDHVIRNVDDYLACWQYIENNPLKYEVTICL